MSDIFTHDVGVFDFKIIIGIGFCISLCRYFRSISFRLCSVSVLVLVHLRCPLCFYMGPSRMAIAAASLLSLPDMVVTLFALLTHMLSFQVSKYISPAQAVSRREVHFALKDVAVAVISAVSVVPAMFLAFSLAIIHHPLIQRKCQLICWYSELVAYTDGFV